MEDALVVTTLVAAALNLLLAALLVAGLRRRRLGWPALAIVLVLFFVARTLERLTEPEAPLGYSVGLDLAVDAALVVLLVLLVLGARSLADAALATVARARDRAEEYARATRDYRRLMRHRLANPLTIIRGAAETLALQPVADEALRRRLLSEIVAAADRLEHLSAEPEPAGSEEGELRPRPAGDDPAESTSTTWLLFRAPTPTPDGQTARDLYEKRLRWIGAEMQASARAHGCRFHRAWHAADGSAFYALALWESREGARAFFEEWEIDAEPGEETIVLEGDVGLVPLP